MHVCFTIYHRGIIRPMSSYIGCLSVYNIIPFVYYMFTWFKLPNPSYSAICIHYIRFSMYTVQRVNAWHWESRMDLRKIESLRIHMTCKFP